MKPHSAVIRRTRLLGAHGSALALVVVLLPWGAGLRAQEPSGSGSAADAPMHDAMMDDAGLVPPSLMTGEARKWMLGYSFMQERMDGNLSGGSRVSDATVLTSFMASPTDMTMRMHALMPMYAPTKKLTLMAMIPYVTKSMNHVMDDGSRFRERTSGIGDIELRALRLLRASRDGRHRLMLRAGVGLPTGSIGERMGGLRLEYPMQLGSGTFSVSPGLTYVGVKAPWGWGAEAIPTVRLGKNGNGYALGNTQQVSAWAARNLARWVSVTLRADGSWRKNVRGVDPVLDAMDEPTKDPALQGAHRLDVSAALDFHPVSGPFRRQRLFVEAGAPVAQSLDGPQLQRRWALTSGLQWEF